MEPRIQYARTKDGVSIAFTTVGRGAPVVLVSPPLVSQTQLEWRQPALRAIFERAAAIGTLVRFDVRGSGLSDRNVDDVCHDGWVRDLEAVADHLGLETFALVGTEATGQGGREGRVLKATGERW